MIFVCRTTIFKYYLLYNNGIICECRAVFTRVSVHAADERITGKHTSQPCLQ